MIYVNVKGQHLDVYNDPIYSDSVNFLTVKLQLSEEWNGYSVTAVYGFKNNKHVSVILNDSTGFYVGDNTYLVPYEVIYSPGFTISLIGTKNESRITTNAAEIEVNVSGYSTGDIPAEPTISEYEQLLLICNNAKAVADSVRQDADNGLFIGNKGDRGEKGDKGDSYILSESDKAEIAEIALALLPSGDEVSY